MHLLPSTIVGQHTYNMLEKVGEWRKCVKQRAAIAKLSQQQVRKILLHVVLFDSQAQSPRLAFAHSSLLPVKF